jgi:hypothetical protein
MEAREAAVVVRFAHRRSLFRLGGGGVCGWGLVRYVANDSGPIRASPKKRGMGRYLTHKKT